jgi:hypothetical protein
MNKFTLDYRFGVVDFFDTETKIFKFSLAIDLQESTDDPRPINKDVVSVLFSFGNNIKGEFSVSIECGKYDGVIFARNLRLKDAIKAINTIADEIVDDDSLRRVVAKYAGRNLEIGRHSFRRSRKR